MKLKLKVADVLLFLQVIGARVIIHVIGFYVKVLGLLEIVVNIKICDELRIQGVVDAFSPSSQLFDRLASLLFELVQKNERVCF